MRKLTVYGLVYGLRFFLPFKPLPVIFTYGLQTVTPIKRVPKTVTYVFKVTVFSGQYLYTRFVLFFLETPMLSRAIDPESSYI
jgi:hypothetical protein